jgi:hypothetical protein
LALSSAKPLDPPVMTATLPSSFPMMTPFGRSGTFSTEDPFDCLLLARGASIVCAWRGDE